jgi:uncharacterized protein (DUF1697 family)
VDRTGRYVALLRGINVGGANLIPMTALRASFEALGLLDVPHRKGELLMMMDA